MKKLLTIALSLLLALNLSACGNNAATAPANSEVSLLIATPGDESSNAQTESKAQEESVPEQKLSATDFLKVILQNNAATSEVSARQQLWQAGYSPAEIKEAIDSAFPKSQSEVKKDESSLVNDSEKKDEESKKEESSKTAEESKSQTSESSQTQQSQSSAGSGNQSSSSSSSSSQQSSSSSESQSQGNSQASSGQSQQSSSSASESQSQSGGQSASEGSTGGSAGSSGSQQQAESSTQESQSSSSGSSASTSQESQQTQESAPAHVHTWVDVTETVHHDAVTEQVWVVDQEAWDETVEVTEEQRVFKYKCRCGLLFSTQSEWEAHSLQYIDDEDDNHYSCTDTYVYETVVVGTETVHHDEVGHYETKTVTEAYDEEVVVGQKCSECGATK